MNMEGGKQTLSDEDLMIAYQEGEFEAFKALFERYERKLFNFFLRGLGGDRQEACDLFQNLFLNVHKARGSYDPRFKVVTWIYAIARNLLKDTWKSKGDKWASDPEEEILDTTPGPEELVSREETKAFVFEGLKMLPASQREVILLAKFEGQSLEEIADITGQSVGAVKQKLHRGYEKLKRIFSQIKLRESSSE